MTKQIRFVKSDEAGHIGVDNLPDVPMHRVHGLYRDLAKKQTKHALNLLDFDATPGQDCTQAFRNAVAALNGEPGTIIVPADPQPYIMEAIEGETVAPYSTDLVGVKLHSGVRLEFSPGAKVHFKHFMEKNPTTGQESRTSKRQLMFLLDKAHDCEIIGLDAYGDATGYDDRGTIMGVVNYRSKRLRVQRLRMDGVSETISFKGNTIVGENDTITDAHLSDIVIGPHIGAGLHLFGHHVRTTLEDYRVKGTLRYDALQIEPVLPADKPAYDVGSKDFIARRVRVDSCAYRGVFINPNAENFLLEDVEVHNVGKLPDGTLVGYDQGTLSREVTNAGITVINSTGTIRNAYLYDAPDINPQNAPVAWSTGGYGLHLVDVGDVSIQGDLVCENNESGEVLITQSGGYKSRARTADFIQRGKVSVDFAGNKYMPPIVGDAVVSDTQGSAVANPLSLINSWNTVGADGAINPRFKLLNVEQPTVTSSLTGFTPGALRFTSAAGVGHSYPIIEVKCNREIDVIKGGQVHLLMLARWNEPASSMAWTLGNVTAERKSFLEARDGFKYEQGATRWVHTSMVVGKGVSFNDDTLKIWLRYGNTNSYDVEIEGVWLYTAPWLFKPRFNFDGVVSSGVPTSGTWGMGDVVWNALPSEGEAPGWVCVGPGTPGSWRAMPALTAV